MIALRTVALIDAARATRLYASELGHSVKVERVHAQDNHRWAVIAPDKLSLEVFVHILPFLALEVWPGKRFNMEARV